MVTLTLSTFDLDVARYTVAGRSVAWIAERLETTPAKVKKSRDRFTGLALTIRMSA